MTTNRTRRRAAAAALGASLLTGGALGAAFVSPLGAGASTLPGAAAGTTDEAAATADRPATPPWATEALDALVADGALTQAQRDTVQARLEAARPERPSGDRGRGGRGPGGGRRGRHLEAAATALGMSARELRTALRDGSTIAEVAGERGVDLEQVVDALVADLSARLDAAVAEGRLTGEQAEARKAALEERATDIVNGVRPAGPRGDAPAGGE